MDRVFKMVFSRGLLNSAQGNGFVTCAYDRYTLSLLITVDEAKPALAVVVNAAEQSGVAKYVEEFTFHAIDCPAYQNHSAFDAWLQSLELSSGDCILLYPGVPICAKSADDYGVRIFHNPKICNLRLPENPPVCLIYCGPDSPTTANRPEPIPIDYK